METVYQPNYQVPRTHGMSYFDSEFYHNQSKIYPPCTPTNDPSSILVNLSQQHQQPLNNLQSNNANNIFNYQSSQRSTSSLPIPPRQFQQPPTPHYPFDEVYNQYPTQHQHQQYILKQQQQYQNIQNSTRSSPISSSNNTPMMNGVVFSTSIDSSPPSPVTLNSSVPVVSSVCRLEKCILCERGQPPILFKVPTWASIMKVVFYTLQVAHTDKEFFSLKTDVYDFMTTHWDRLYMNKKKSENWRKQVQDMLSHSKNVFESGMEKIKQNGYWRLKNGFDPWELREYRTNSPTDSVPRSPDQPYSSSPSKKRGHEESESESDLLSSEDMVRPISPTKKRSSSIESNSSSPIQHSPPSSPYISLSSNQSSTSSSPILTNPINNPKNNNNNNDIGNDKQQIPQQFKTHSQKINDFEKKDQITKPINICITSIPILATNSSSISVSSIASLLSPVSITPRLNRSNGSLQTLLNSTQDDILSSNSSHLNNTDNFTWNLKSN